jgi:dienelactone hydrolase
MMRVSPLLAALAVGALLAVGPAAAQPSTGPGGGVGGVPANEEIIRIPRAGTKAGLVTRICRPNTKEAAPLVVINHGRPSGPTAEERNRRRAAIRPFACGSVASAFTARGYVVAFPVRQGYGESGGEDKEGGGACNNADFVSAANAGADDVAVAIAHLAALPYVVPGKTVVVGQSVGGLVTLALASRNLDGVSAYVNFAGGHGGHRNGKPNSNCSPDALVAAAAHYGRTVRRPMLWIYTENDTYFGPQLSRRMFAAFSKAGGTARFELLPPLRTERTQDGHDLLFVGADIWEPIVFPWLDANAK